MYGLTLDSFIKPVNYFSLKGVKQSSIEDLAKSLGVEFLMGTIRDGSFVGCAYEEDIGIIREREGFAALTWDEYFRTPVSEPRKAAEAEDEEDKEEAAKPKVDT